MPHMPDDYPLGWDRRGMFRNFLARERRQLTRRRVRKHNARAMRMWMTVFIPFEVCVIPYADPGLIR